MNELSEANSAQPLPLLDELKAVVARVLPQTPAQFAECEIKKRWDVDPQSALLVTLDYDYAGHPAQNGLYQGQVTRSQTLVQALLSNYQTVADGRFGENAFGLFTPPDVGPSVRIVENVDEFAYDGSGNHKTYEGIYRSTLPQTYGPQTQISLRPADFKKWVWLLSFKDLYQAYVESAWPADEAIEAVKPFALRMSTKAAFVMAAWLQRKEGCLSEEGLHLAMRSAGLPIDQAWETLTIQQLQAPTRIASGVEVSRLLLYRYSATDIWCYRDRTSGKVLMYIPGNSSPLHEFADGHLLRRWIVDQGRLTETRQALASHFAEDDRRDGTFHAGVLTALDGMVKYPQQHRLTKEAGFFNNDGYWNPEDYIGFDPAPAKTDPFAQLVLSMKQAAQASVDTIRDDAQVNRDNLSAVVEPIVHWVSQFGPLALFVPGGEGLLALAGAIDAAYGLDQALNGETAEQRSEGVTRTVFGLLNALPLVADAASSVSKGTEAGAQIKLEDAQGEPSLVPGPEPAVIAVPGQSTSPMLSRTDLLRGVGAPAGTFNDEVLAQIGRVSAVSDDMLRLMQSGRAPTPLLADTIDRFRIDQEVRALPDTFGTPGERFNRLYQALQRSEHQWVQLFQRQYPDVPKLALEQLLDRYGVDFKAEPDAAEARRLFRQLNSKARQFQQHVRLNRAFEGLYLHSVANPEADTLALHSLKNLPGWSKGLRIDVRDGSIAGRLLDRSGPLDAVDCRIVIKSGTGYLSGSSVTDFYEAVAGVLSKDERSALGLRSRDLGGQLKLQVGERLLSRSELILGLGRMDSGLPFEAYGLRGGGYPGTPQAAALTWQVSRLQVKDIYPEFSDAEADEVLQRLGGNAQRHLEELKRQMHQLYSDIDTWIDQVGVDIDDMEVAFLQMGDPGTEGLDHTQLAAQNARTLQDAMRQEAATRNDLADELIDIWKKRSPQQQSHYSGNHVDGFVMNLSHEDYHRLPALNVRFNDVVELNLRNFHLTERETLNGFLERFPNLRTLDLQDTDLRLPNIDGELESALPPTIAQLQHLTVLNLRATQLTFEEATAGQLSSLTQLQSLDLSDNPLGVPPIVMGMAQLRSLNLSNTGITTCPAGIMDQPYLTTLDLRDNQIRRVPQAILNQAIARDRVLLWNNPLDDEDTLRRLVSHRQRTGVNLWLSVPGHDYSGPAAWLREIEGAPREAGLQIWQRLALRPGGARFLGTINALTLTADFQVDYLDLQARVWQLLTEAEASQELWARLPRNIRLPSGAFDNPFAVFTALEDGARLYNDWVALGRPFPTGEGAL
ncbi:dermonecrotic toxin domain-containing protein [Pseudomonas sp. P1.8]|uniref:dermonecrotic toxin domain-containing protein n=1 Tax=Pseudomonas sp. P1.8 TaxID=1699310 RepID=UPI00069F8E3F|nr:DUF6543 domain-containing protein [Pseudomonas sp. P1.8]